MVDVPVELVVVMSMRALMVDRLRLSTANINIVVSQLVKLMMMVVIVNLYTLTRLNIKDCNIGGCGKIGTRGNNWLTRTYQYTEYQYVLLCHNSLETVVWEELELQEHEEPEEDCIRWDVGLVDESEGLVRDEHLR